MNIRSITNSYGPQRVTAPTAGSPAKGGSDAAPAAAPSGAARQDSVAISDAGRALSGGEAPAAKAANGSLTPERVAGLRKKVLEGAYNSTHVVDSVAKRLLSTGDV